MPAAFLLQARVEQDGQRESAGLLAHRVEQLLGDAVALQLRLHRELFEHRNAGRLVAPRGVPGDDAVGVRDEHVVELREPGDAGDAARRLLGGGDAGAVELLLARGVDGDDAVELGVLEPGDAHALRGGVHGRESVAPRRRRRQGAGRRRARSGWRGTSTRRWRR